jgi:hypothetical protein
MRPPCTNSESFRIVAVGFLLASNAQRSPGRRLQTSQANCGPAAQTNPECVVSNAHQRISRVPEQAGAPARVRHEEFAVRGAPDFVQNVGDGLDAGVPALSEERPIRSCRFSLGNLFEVSQLFPSQELPPSFFDTSRDSAALHPCYRPQLRRRDLTANEANWLQQRGELASTMRNPSSLEASAPITSRAKLTGRGP